MTNEAIAAVLLDIEGTVAPISFVHDVLFPYARLKLNEWLSSHRDEPVVREALSLIRQSTGADSQTLLSVIVDLMNADSKDTGLKQLQGLIWAGGYRSGELRSPVFADVVPALRHWHDSGKRLAIYSSGSVAAQKLFFAHTDAGDISPLLSAYFDTTTGPKRMANSYRSIASQLELTPGRIVFCTDVAEEANAAIDAGLSAAILIRPGNAPLTAPSTARLIHSCAELHSI